MKRYKNNNYVINMKEEWRLIIILVTKRIQCEFLTFNGISRRLNDDDSTSFYGCDIETLYH